MAIKALPTEVRNSLRTGLVISNASQCVFELVLNSLDARANAIAIRVDLIAHKLQVVDNGCGMDKNTLDLVGLRYMTSKCHSLEDLRKPLGQFGFRGEALASLRNVSRLMTIESRGANCSATFSKVFEEGNACDAVLSTTQRPSQGTTVTIQDFMYNMPVRRHRIRDALSLEEIKGLIEATALTHPQVSFSLRNDVNGSMILKTFRTMDTLKTFSYLFGQDITPSLIHVTHSLGNFKVFGYISNEGHFQSNLQFIYLNKRLVNKTKIHKFITSLLLKSFIFSSNRRCETRNVKSKSNGNWLSYSPAPNREKFPVYLLNIKCGYKEYDVSFDAKKTLLEFINWDSILNCLEEVIVKFLDEKCLGDVETNISITKNESSDASVFREIDDLTKEHALGLVECILSDDSTKQSKNNGGETTIRLNSDCRQGEREVIDSEYVTSNGLALNKCPLSETCLVSDIECPSKLGLEERKQHSNNQSIAVNRWVEDPLTPSPANNSRSFPVDTSSSLLSKHESTYLSEDPMVYSDNEYEEKCQQLKRFTGDSRYSTSKEGTVVKPSSRLIETRHESGFNKMFSLPLFPSNKNTSEYIGLRDVMQRVLRHIENMSRSQIGNFALNKSNKRNVLTITQRKLTVNESLTVQSKTANTRVAKTFSGNDHKINSMQADVNKSPYFKFLPVIVDNNNDQEKRKPMTSQPQCVRSPYFTNAPLQQGNASAVVKPASNISNVPFVQSPYFNPMAKRSQIQIKSNSTRNTIFQDKNYPQILRIDQPICVDSSRSKPSNIVKYIPDMTLLSRVVVNNQGRQFLSNPDDDNNDTYTMETRKCCCPIDEHIDDQFVVNHVNGHTNNYQPTLSDNVRNRFTSMLKQCNDPKVWPSQPFTLFDPVRNYLTTSDLICTLETVRRNSNRPTNVFSIDECHMPTPRLRVPRITWGNVQYHSANKSNQNHDCSENRMNVSFSSGSSVNYYDTVNNSCETCRQIPRALHNVVSHDDNFRSIGFGYRQVEGGVGELRRNSSETRDHDQVQSLGGEHRQVTGEIGERKYSSSRTHQTQSLGYWHRRNVEGGIGEWIRSSSTHDGDNELTTETEWSSIHNDGILKKKNQIYFESIRDNVRKKSDMLISDYHLKSYGTPTSSEYEGENDVSAPQSGVHDVINVQDRRLPLAPQQSPSILTFNQLFSFSESEDEKRESSNRTGAAEEHCTTSEKRESSNDTGTTEEHCTTSEKRESSNGTGAGEEHYTTSLRRKRKQEDTVDDNSKKPRREGEVAGITDTVRDCRMTGPSDSCVGDTLSERSSGEEFLAYILREKPLKLMPKRQPLEHTTHQDRCNKVQHITPDDGKERCGIIEAMKSDSNSGHHQVLISSASLDAALNVDNEKQDCVPENHQEKQLSSNEASECAFGTDQLNPLEDERSHSDPKTEEVTCIQAEWGRRLDAEGITIFVHFRTGMTSFEPPGPSSGGDPYTMAHRYHFLPKGMSPILKETPGSSGAVQDLSLVKWRDDQPNCEDLIKQLVEDTEKRMAFCEPLIPNTHIQDRNSVGIYHLLTSYSFTKDIFNSLEVLGQLDNKFIVTLVSVEPEKSPHLLVLFDQHAVDERIRLENLVEDYLAVGVDTQFKTTPITSPILVNLAPQELRIVSSFEKEFERIGLKFEVKSDTCLKVTSVPSCLKARETRVSPQQFAALLTTSIGTLVKGHAGAIVAGGGVGPCIPNTLQGCINSEACRGAIKFGDSLSIDACKRMLTSLSKCALPFQCAHGRPSLVPLADIGQIQMQHRQVDTKPNYLNIKKYLKEV